MSRTFALSHGERSGVDRRGQSACYRSLRRRWGEVRRLRPPDSEVTPSAGTTMARLDEICCPIARTASLIGDRWTPLIVRDLAPGCRRFGELQRSLGSISPKTLSERLRRLEDGQIVTRSCFAEMPPRVDYCLTDKGHALVPIIESMRDFGVTWLTSTTAFPHPEPGR